MSLVEARALSFTYPRSSQKIIHHLSLSIEAGEFVSVQGPSGSGKSTLLYLLAGFLKPSAGHVFFDGQDLQSLDAEDTAIFRNRHMGFIFQQFHLMSRKSVLENVLLPDTYPVEMDRPGSDNHREHAIEILARLGLREKLHVSPNQLSGGQQQRVAIARALLHRPKVLFADEPTGNLDSKTGQEIFGVLEELSKEGITVIIITHDEQLARRTARKIDMRDGEIISDETKAKPNISGGLSKEDRAWNLAPTFSQITKLSRIAWGELQRNRSRSVLTLLGIMFGVAAVSSMIALGDYTKRNMLKSYQEMGVNTFGLTGYENWMSSAKSKAAFFQGFQQQGDIDTLFRVFPELERWTPLFGGGSGGGAAQVIYGGKYMDNAMLTGMNENGLDLMQMQLSVGRNFHALQVDQARSVCMIGSEIRRQLFGLRSPIDEWITMRLDDRYFSCQVIGALKPMGNGGDSDFKNKQVYVPDKVYIRQVNYWWSTKLHSFLLEARPGVDIEKMSRAVVKFFKSKYGDSGEFFESTNASMISQMKKFLTLFTILLLFVATLALVVGCIGVSNMMTVSVTERLSEFGLRKALGATDRSLRLQILIESSILCLFAGAVGVLIGFVFQQTAIYSATKLFPKLTYSWEFNWGAIVISMIATFLAGYLSGLSAAEKVESLSVAEVLRSE